MYNHPIPRHKCIAWGLNNYQGGGSSPFLLAHERRALVTGIKTPVADGAKYGNISGLSLSGSSFLYRELLYFSGTNAAQILLFDSRDGSGLNGYAVAITGTGGGSKLTFAMADADALEINISYPAPTNPGLLYLDITWTNGSYPIVKYNGITQAIDTETTYNTVTAFTANQTAKIGARYDNAFIQDNLEYYDIIVGSNAGAAHRWPHIEGDGVTVYDVIGSSDITYTSAPNWAVSSTITPTFQNTHGFTLNAGVYIPAVSQSLDAQGNALENKASEYLFYNATTKLLTFPYHSELEALGLSESLTFAQIQALADYDDRIYLNEVDDPEFFNLMAFYDNLTAGEKVNITRFLSRSNVPGATALT